MNTSMLRRTDSRTHFACAACGVPLTSSGSIFFVNKEMYCEDCSSTPGKCTTQGCDGLALAIFDGQCQDCWEYTSSREYEEGWKAARRARWARRLKKWSSHLVTAFGIVLVGGTVFYLAWQVANAFLAWFLDGGMQ